MIDIFSLTTNDLVSQLKEGKISSVEVCTQYIERINKFEKDVKAWVHFNKRELLEKAAEADEYRKSGKPLGSLHGLPIAVKDIIGTLDMPTECGTSLRKKMAGSQDAEVVNLIKIAGAIVMGKTVTTELAYFHPGKTTNPHDYSRTPGGSSSGSAAVVAAHMAPLSIGSQTNGSTIRPASYCGVVGYKPSYGLISRSGVLRQSDKLDHIGIFGKTVEDVALLARSLIKKDLYDKSTIHYSADEMLEVCKKGPFFEPKFIFYRTDNWKNIDKDSQKSFEFLIKKFKKNIEIFDTPSYFKDIPKYHKIIHETDMANNFQDYYKQSKKKLSKPMIDAIERGQKYSAKDYAEAIDFMKQSYESYKEVFEDYHGVLSPATTGVANKGLKSTGSPEFCTVWTYMGMPSISLPLLMGANNLPLGVQLAGDKLDDLRFLGIANWLEKNCKNYDE
jgi:Asp-tRNA(Asn)/Glu-tRNA(Gln) amidotransferase A subunit family amidase